MIEQLFFIILAIILFGIIFLKLIKKNDTSYVIILAIAAVGIAIDFLELVSNSKVNIFLKIISYILAIIIPGIVIWLEKKNIK